MAIYVGGSGCGNKFEDYEMKGEDPKLDFEKQIGLNDEIKSMEPDKKEVKINFLNISF